MLNKNQIINLEITDYDYEGLGIGHFENYTVFVPRVLIGEIIVAKILKATKTIAFAKVEKILKQSENRQVPECEYYRLCGGCQLLHMKYDEQLRMKKQALVNTIYKLNGNLKINDILVSKEFGYRNKVALPIRNIDGTLKVGFYQEKSHHLIPSNYCLLESMNSRIIVNEFLDLFNKNNLEAFEEGTNKGLLKHIITRENSNNEFMVTIVAKYKDEKLIDLLKKTNIANVKSLYLNIHPDNTNVIIGKTFIHINGEEYLFENILGNIYKLHPNSFMQVNRYGMEVLYKKAIEYLEPKKNEVVLDAYCGIGTIGLSFAKLVKKVIGVEIVEEAIINAKDNAKLNDINNAEFYCGKAEELISKILLNEKIDSLVVDPPRKGCDSSFLDAIINAKINKIVYISCNPATLSRDLKYLSEYYEVKEMTPVEMFANTMHVETVCCLVKTNKSLRK